MGMYSEVYNSCSKIGHEFVGLLQTKQLTSLLDLFWISPSGELFEIRVPWVDEGERGSGVVRPYRLTGVLQFSAIYRNQYKEAYVYFRYGVLTEVLSGTRGWSVAWPLSASPNGLL
jgi:hypothetical protein